MLILDMVRQGISYPVIQAKFEAMHGWKPSKCSMTSIMNGSADKNDKNELSTDVNSPIVSDDEKRHEWIQKTEHELLLMTKNNLSIMASYIYDKNIPGSPGEVAQTRLDRVRLLIGDMNATISQFFNSANRTIESPKININADHVNLGAEVNPDNWTRDQKERFFVEFQKEVCGRCKRPKVIDIKEV